MGGIFSKGGTNKVVPEPAKAKPTSAPARLEGLDGCEDPVQATRRAITPSKDPVGFEQDRAGIRVR